MFILSICFGILLESQRYEVFNNNSAAALMHDV